jgi:hypothetical protein
VGLGILAAGDPSGLVVSGASVEVGIGRRAGRLGARADATATQGRRVPLGGGNADWSRASFGLGVRALLLGRVPRLVVHAGPRVALLLVEGTGYASNDSDSVVVLGAGAGLRLAWPLGRLTPWLDLCGAFWPGVQRLVVGGAVAGMTGAATHALSGLEAQIALGLSVRAL